MKTQALHPQHLLLGIKPEPISTSRWKVIISMLFISICTAVMIYQEVDPLRNRLRTIKTKVVSKIRNSGRKPLDYSAV